MEPSEKLLATYNDLMAKIIDNNVKMFNQISKMQLFLIGRANPEEIAKNYPTKAGLSNLKIEDEEEN